jgi:hypothetical protein
MRMINDFNSFSDVDVQPSSTSYFSEPSSGLDPKLFEGMHLRPWVRNSVLRILFDHLAVMYQEPNLWVSAWLAGSGVSYQWESARQPGDLDCLVGIDYVKFRRTNSDFTGMSNEEIAGMFNEEFASQVMPKTSNWEGFELTYYVNPQSNIVDINPYAAYDLINDDWTVKPSQDTSPPYSRVWGQSVERDYNTAIELVNRYGQALAEFRGSTSSANRVNAERKLQLAIDQAADMYENIHHGRKIAFSKTGAGYEDYHNYRWQAGKQSGIVQALKMIKDYRDSARKSDELETYGIELPTPDTLIRRTVSRKSPLQ